MTDPGVPIPVMAGLVPAIHVAPPGSAAMDARNESGHDEGRAAVPARVPGRVSGAGR